MKEQARVSNQNGGAPAMAISPEKEKALAAAMTQIDRKFGKGSIMKMGEASSRLTIEVIPTGSIALDIALGVGGLPRGRVIEIFGPESSGKTTLAQHIIAEAPEDRRYVCIYRR
jgi:recombination protein RecA